MVTFLELLGVGIGGASVFGLIVRAFSIYNGRTTRGVIVEEVGRTREMIAAGRKGLGEVLGKLSEQHMTMIELLNPRGRQELGKGKRE